MVNQAPHHRKIYSRKYFSDNEWSFYSAPHGAGRKMSWTKAKQSFIMKNMEAAMAGIEFRKSPEIDETEPTRRRRKGLYETWRSGTRLR